MRPVSVPFHSRGPSPYVLGTREISVAAEHAREKLREEFDQLRVGIEKLRAEEPDSDGPLFAISDGAERARGKLREEFDQLRAGIEKLQAKGKR
jgi:hypothetical protein